MKKTDTIIIDAFMLRENNCAKNNHRFGLGFVSPHIWHDKNGVYFAAVHCVDCGHFKTVLCGTDT